MNATLTEMEQEVFFSIQPFAKVFIGHNIIGDELLLNFGAKFQR